MITFKKLLLESEYENDIDSAAEEISKILKSELEHYLKTEIKSNRINKNIFTELVLDNPFYEFVNFEN
jgi:hypothetical protein